MKLTLASAATAAMIVLALPAYAQPGMELQGMDFNNTCEGDMKQPFCYGYVTGFFYALEADGQLCPAGTPDNAQMVKVVAKWLRWHNAGPPKNNIRAALLNAWGCRRQPLL
jgi:hypothetical protein